MARFSALGKEYELATIDSLSFDEAREFKRVSKMAPGGAAITALFENDPDVWLGLLTVSIQRAEGDFEAGALGSENLTAVIGSIAGDEDVPLVPENQPPEEVVTPVESPSRNGGAGETSPSAVVATPEEAEARS